MSPPQEPKIQRVKITDIEVDPNDRLRDVSAAGVDSLIASIKDLGVLTDPIKLRRKGRGDATKLVLMAGAHRLEAARQLGWETIPARVWADVTDSFAAYVEVDDNMAGKPLDALDKAVFMAARKRVYEDVHPETKYATGAALISKRWDTTAKSAVVSFVKAEAETTGVSPRKIFRYCAIGETLSRADVRQLRSARAPIKSGDLDALAKLNDPTERAEVIAHIGSGTANSVAEALAKIHPKAERPDDKVEAALAQLLTVWGRAPKAAQRRFAAEIEAEFVAILNDRSNPAGV